MAYYYQHYCFIQHILSFGSVSCSLVAPCSKHSFLAAQIYLVNSLKAGGPGRFGGKGSRHGGGCFSWTGLGLGWGWWRRLVEEAGGGARLTESVSC